LEEEEVKAPMFPSVPDEKPTSMPTQVLKNWHGRRVPTTRHQTVWIRRTAVSIASLALTATASLEMYHVLSINSMTALQVALLIAFTLNFIWIALPFVSGLVGFISLWCGRDVSGIAVPPLQPTPRLNTRTALLMPIYNEAPQRVFAGIQSMYESLQAMDALAHFDFFILSDTTEPNLWLDEEVAFSALLYCTQDYKHIFYRHRSRNIRRKAGNIADFCQRWGALYEYMIVLDADSLMTGGTMVRLASAMEANPDTGLIQTSPLVVNRNTLFARAQQFAARIYGPVMTSGLAYWHQGDSSYWGHNAIIRTKAFIAHAGLPDLSGQPPLGGQILSHDFVEAALMRRAGWKIYLAYNIAGSYEESPPSLLDFAERDRRWCQGNLQHSRIVPTSGLHGMSRLHLIMGIMSYLASPIWLVFLLLGLLLALQAHFIRPEYFTEQFALFPRWPVFDPERAIRLFGGTMAVLLAPKLFGYLWLCKDSQIVRLCGGRLRAGLSVLIETLLSALLAPVTMVMQTASVFSILTGRTVGWTAQRRDDGSIPLRNVVCRHLVHTLLGLALALVAYAVSPPFLAWLSPVVLGLLLAIPLSLATGRQDWGQALRRLGLLLTPEESEPPSVLQRANELADELTTKRPLPALEAIERWVRDTELRTLHAAMLLPRPAKRKGEYDLDLLTGLAKLQDADSVEEASSMLSNREKLMVLGDDAGVGRLHQLAAMRGLQDERPPE
jgi:membrane glycosyltransferase